MEKAYFSFDYQALIFLLFFDFPGAKCGYFYTKKRLPENSDSLKRNNNNKKSKKCPT